MTTRYSTTEFDKMTALDKQLYTLDQRERFAKEEILRKGKDLVSLLRSYADRIEDLVAKGSPLSIVTQMEFTQSTVESTLRAVRPEVTSLEQVHYANRILEMAKDK